jgi:AmpE protein
MTLIYLLITIFAERVLPKPEYLRTDFYYGRYKRWLLRRQYLHTKTSTLQLGLIVFLPALLVQLLVSSVEIALVTFVLTLLALFTSIGSSALREAFRSYLSAAARGDLQACDMHARELGLPDHCPQTVAGHLVWLNYQRYAAPIVMFVCFNVFGIIAYSTLRTINGYSQKHNLPIQTQTQWLLFVIDWLPVRIAAFGFLMVGHYSRAFPVWTALLRDKHTAAKDVLVKVAVAAEDVTAGPDDMVTEAKTLVSLAKRNILFMLSMVAILTLLGVVH